MDLTFLDPLVSFFLSFDDYGPDLGFIDVDEDVTEVKT